METVKLNWDVIVVGAGPGGLTAALYASRANLSTLVIERGLPGGELNNTADIENYPGVPAVSGPELAQRFVDSTMAYGAEHIYGDVTDIDIDGTIKTVHVGDTVYTASVLIIATGAENRKLGVPGEAELAGRGVSYCAVCDGFFFRDKNLIVVGGGDSAVEEGTYLTQYANKVTIVHRRDQLRAQKILQERAFKNDKVDFVWNATIDSINGNETVESVTMRDTRTGETRDIDAQGVFVYVGLVPNTDMFSHLNITDDAGWILTDERMATAIPGVFAVGDVRQKHLRQVATAVGDGSIAGQAAYDYIQQLQD